MNDRSTHPASPRGRGIRETIGDRELLVASNREPYEHEYEDAEITVSRPAGGLTAALDPILQEAGGTWIAWGSGDADFDLADDQDRVRVPPDAPAYTLERLRLSDDEVEGYYDGFCNRQLWPMCHDMPTRATFDEDHWRQYVAVNERFADRIAESATTADPAVWLHDYHLGFAPALLRQRLDDPFLAQFWHIPWPTVRTFSACPHGPELLSGLLANDVLSFHRDSHCRSFLACVEEAIDDAVVDHAGGQVIVDGHTTTVRCAPLGIDAADHAATAASDTVDRHWEAFASAHDLGGTVAVGVDRVDYTKGILLRLDALECLWERRPDLRGELTYVQKGSLSRSHIEDYRQLQDEVEERIAGINERFSTDEWTPIVYTTEHYSRAELTALYRHADLALVSPLRDGMNLVAKEFVAAQVDDDGVIVLSKFAGAADTMGNHAVVTNPFDTEAFAASIEAALAMPERTRRRRIRSLRDLVHEEDPSAWAAAQFQGIDDGARCGPGPSGWNSTPVSAWSATNEIREALETADGLLLGSDFDGTLADIVERPDRAAIRPEARATLQRLGAHDRTAVAVVSGRQVDDVRERVGLDGLAYVGNHGLETVDGEERWIHPLARQAGAELRTVCDDLRRRFATTDGVVVEDKGLTASVHFRRSPVTGSEVLAGVREAVSHAARPDVLAVSPGKQVIEIGPATAWGKGRALDRLRERLTPADERWPLLYLGDDTSDESAFRALGQDDVSIAVGSTASPTAADYALTNPAEVADFLTWLAESGLAGLEERARRQRVEATR